MENKKKSRYENQKEELARLRALRVNMENKKRSSEDPKDRKKRIDFKEKNQADQFKSIFKDPSNFKYKLGFKGGGLIKKGKPKIATKGWR